MNEPVPPTSLSARRRERLAALRRQEKSLGRGSYVHGIHARAVADEFVRLRGAVAQAHAVDPSTWAPGWEIPAPTAGQDGPAIRVGHRTGDEPGETSTFAVEDAEIDEDPSPPGGGVTPGASGTAASRTRIDPAPTATGQTMPPGPGGGSSDASARRATILIGGVPVDRSSALRWAGRPLAAATGLSRELVLSAPRHPGAPAPGFIADAAAIDRFRAEVVARIGADPCHPLRFLIRTAAPAEFHHRGAS